MRDRQLAARQLDSSYLDSPENLAGCGRTKSTAQSKPRRLKPAVILRHLRHD
jgi:hypothetical protein